MAAPPERAVLAALRASGSELEQVSALLTAAGCPAETVTVAEGDRLLLGLHRRLTGRDLELVVSCPACGTASEIRLGPDAVPPVQPRSARCGSGGGLRQPGYADLRALPDDPAEAAAELVRRCTVGRPSVPPVPADLDRIDDSLCGAMVFGCAGCGQAVESTVDVQVLVLDALARLVHAYDAEVHLLARTYHWDLATIEGLPPERRRRLAALIADEG